MITEKTKIRTFDEMREASGLVAALNAHFGAYGTLPEPRFPGEYHEALGLADLGEDVESYILSTFPR